MVRQQLHLFVFDFLEELILFHHQLLGQLTLIWDVLSQRDERDASGEFPRARSYIWDSELDGPFSYARDAGVTPDPSRIGPSLEPLEYFLDKLWGLFEQIVDGLLEGMQKLKRIFSGGGPQRPSPA
jgi:hypothetical protein